MKKRIARYIIMVGLTALLGLLRVGAQGGETERQEIDAVEVWRRTDIVLHSKTEYENPYADVEIDAVFTHEDGDEIRLYGFWNGGDEWRVRFAPTKAGRWDYAVSCSDGGNEGLGGVKGSVLAVENKGTTELDRHGFVAYPRTGGISFTTTARPSSGWATQTGRLRITFRSRGAITPGAPARTSSGTRSTTG